MNLKKLSPVRFVSASFLGLLPLVSLSQTPSGYIADWKNDAQGAYTIIHDDYGDTGVDGIWQYADTICHNRGIKFTFGAIASACEVNRNVNGYSTPYSYAKNVMMAQHNHEIMSHSHTHDCAVGNAGWSPCDALPGEAWGEDVNGANFYQQIHEAHNSIETGTGFTPKYYIFPYDRFSDAANDTLKDMGYLGTRTGWTSPRSGDASYYRNGYENNDNSNYYPDADGFFRTAVQVFDANDQALSIAGQVAVLNNEVDNAIANNQWANRELHNVGSTGWGSVQVEAYRMHITYIKSKVDAGELWVGTVSEFLTYQMQKLKYSPNVTYNATSEKVFVTWNTINPQYNVSLSSYLSGLTISSPVTIVVDMDGMTDAWFVKQGSNLITDYTQVGDKLHINVYPHEGSLEIYKAGGGGNQNPYVQNILPDYPNLIKDFSSFTIDLKDIFEDTETTDANLLYTYSGNSGVSISILNGVATISSVASWTGTETITFTVEDEGGLTVSDAFDVTVTDPFANQWPFGGNEITIPGKVESENYDEGVEGEAYHEVNTAWEPDAVDNPYRPNSDPDVYAITAGGFGLGFTETGEWLEYSVNVVATGWYNVVFRISQDEDQWNTPNGYLKLYVDNQELVPSLFMPYTEDWDSYQDVEYANAVELMAGSHILKLEFVAGNVNIDYINISDSPTNSSDELSISEYSLYPNPVTDFVNFNGQFETASIYNQVGELVLTTSANAVDISEFANGIYYVKFNNANGMLKFVKTK